MNEINLTDVLEEYALAAPHGFDQKVLKEMIEKYAQFAEELKDFAAASAVVKFAPETEMSEVDESRYREIGLQNLQMVLSEMNPSAPEIQVQNALVSLTDAAKEKGMNRSKFAAALGLSVSLVQYLEKRRLEFATIPKAVIEKISGVLETSEDVINSYLNQSPVGAEGASFKASERPEELKPKNFADAVREDQQLSATDKQKLLEL